MEERESEVKGSVDIRQEGENDDLCPASPRSSSGSISRQRRVWAEVYIRTAEEAK
jgi:hypothetical protein